MTDKAREDYEVLRKRAERFNQYPKQAKPLSAHRLRNKCVRWLREQLPDSGLADDLLEQRNASAHLCLRALNRAKELLPFLRDDSDTKLPKPENVRKVFVVHGHNDALKNAVARVLEKLELQPVILHEQPNKGRTIIEKFLDYADVAFAVVLLTPDDLGGLASGDVSKFKPRARQNVILELGFFLGKLSRKRVAAIYTSGVELPSDYSGVLFIPHDEAGVWQYQLAKEFKAAGVRIDLNKL